MESAQRILRRGERGRTAERVKVAPPLAPSGVMAWIGASVLFEILCLCLWLCLWLCLCLCVCLSATAAARRLGRAPVICEAIPEPRA